MLCVAAASPVVSDELDDFVVIYVGILLYLFWFVNLEIHRNSCHIFTRSHLVTPLSPRMNELEWLILRCKIPVAVRRMRRLSYKFGRTNVFEQLRISSRNVIFRSSQLSLATVWSFTQYLKNMRCCFSWVVSYGDALSKLILTKRQFSVNSHIVEMPAWSLDSEVGHSDWKFCNFP